MLLYSVNGFLFFILLKAAHQITMKFYHEYFYQWLIMIAVRVFLGASIVVLLITARYYRNNHRLDTI